MKTPVTAGCLLALALLLPTSAQTSTYAQTPLGPPPGGFPMPPADEMRGAPPASPPAAPGPATPAPTALAPTALAPTALAPTALAPTALAPTAPAPGAPPGLAAPGGAPADTIVPPLPTPVVGDDASIRQYLGDARAALVGGRVGEAEEALERAETRMLDRSVAPSRVGDTIAGPGIDDIGAARRALAARDVPGAIGAIDAALARR